MSLQLVRVDDRLIHGQVAAIWVKALSVKRIVILDDRTANDEFLSEVIKLASPPGIAVEIYPLNTGIARVKEVAADPEPAFVIMRSPLAALRLREEGVEYPVLNVGGIGAGPGRKPLYRNISASDQELEAMRKLEALGTSVELRIVASDRPVAFRSLDK